MALEKEIESVSGVPTKYQQIACFYAHHDGSVKIVVRRFVNAEKRDAGAAQVEERTHEITDSDALSSIWKAVHEAAKKYVPELEGATDIYEAVSVTLDKSSIELVAGESATLTETVLPAEAPDKTVSWSSSNEAVATVVGGKVEAVAGASGTANIVCTTNKRKKIATCAVTVKAKEAESETSN